MVILDTNVISETMRPVPSSQVLTWWSRQPGSELYVTTINVAEVLYGVETLPHGKRRAALLAGAERMFGKIFASRILPFDEAAAHAFAEIAAARRAQGRPIAEMDAQIAAIARAHGAALATRNVEDFEGCGVTLINPWQP